MGHVQDTPVSTSMISNVCMICHMKVHIVSYNLDQKKISKSKIHTLPKYEQTDLKTAIVALYYIIFLDNASEDHDGEGLYWHQLQPLLKTLRSCSNVQHLILGFRSYCVYHMDSLVQLVYKYLPQISTVTINDTGTYNVKT